MSSHNRAAGGDLHEETFGLALNPDETAIEAVNLKGTKA